MKCRVSSHRSITLMRRRGITLMEVIIALAIFSGSVLVLSRLVGYGTNAVQRARLETDAALIAESVMNEVTSGVIPLRNQMASVSNRPPWKWRLEVSKSSVSGLHRAKLVVFPDASGPLAQRNGEFRFALERWINVTTPTARDRQ